MSAIEKILCEAYRAGATDVHLSVGSQPKMRLAGQLVSMDYSRLTAQDTLDFVLQFMSEAQRELLEERGDISFALNLAGCGRLRVNAYKRSGTTALAFRLVGERIPWPEELGLPEELIQQCEKKSGFVLVTGTAGSGKTTTLAALINRINESRAAHIMTLERPIEYVHPHKTALVNQREIGVDAANLLEGLKSVCGQDVDVLVLGELNGAPAVEEALNAAESGVLVFAEVTAPGAQRALEQLIDDFQVPKQIKIEKRLKNVLGAVVFQQMLPKDGGGQYVAYKMLDLKC